MGLYTFVRSIGVSIFVLLLIDLLNAAKDDNSGSKKSGSSDSSDKKMTKLQLGLTTKTPRRVGIEVNKQSKNRKRKGTSFDSNQIRKNLSFNKLESIHEKGNGNLLQLLEEKPKVNKVSIPAKKEVRRLLKARKLSLNPVETNNWDREKLKDKLLKSEERNRKRPLAQLRGSKHLSSTTALIQLGSDTGSSRSKQAGLNTDPSLSRSNTFSDPRNIESSRASSATKPESSSGSIDIDARPQTH